MPWLESLLTTHDLKLNQISRQLLSISSFPLDVRQDGSIEFYENAGFLEGKGLTRGNKRRKAMQSYALSTADARLYDLNDADEQIESAPQLERIKAPKMDVKKPASLSEKLTFLNRENTIRIIGELYSYTVGQFTQRAFAPFFINGAQIEVTDLIQRISHRCDSDLKKMQAGKTVEGITILDTPTSGFIVSSITRGYTLPFFLPLNKNPSDFDSGQCDYHANTSFRRNEKVQILAISGDLSLIISEAGQFAWVDTQHVTETSDQTEQTLYDAQKVFYVGPKPHFYEANGKKRVLRPFDELYQRGHDFYVFVKGRRGATYFEEISGLGDSAITPELDFSDPTQLQTAVNILFSVRMPYTSPVDDCSGTVSDFMRLGGITIGRFSGDQMTHLQELFKNQNEVTTETALSSVAPGLYTINLLYPDGTEFVSKHIFIAHVDLTGKITAFSQTFAILGDKGIEEPIGPHVCHNEALLAQLSKGRKLVFTQIAA